MAYTYRFIDSEGRIIYIGKTTSIDHRMAQHFGGRGHLSQEAYNSVARIEYMKHKTESDALVYETWLITKYAPKYNKMQQSRDTPTIKLNDEDWKLYRQMKPVNQKRANTGWWKYVAWIYLATMLIYYLFINK